MSIKDWVEGELGLESIDDLYPVVTTDGRLFQLSDLIFFGYGPNYFDWTKQKPFKLKGEPTILYLISMDVGKIAGKKVLVSGKLELQKERYRPVCEKQSLPQVGDNVSIMRQKLYKDGRDAFMIEQQLSICLAKNTLRQRKRVIFMKKVKRLRRLSL